MPEKVWYYENKLHLRERSQKIKNDDNFYLVYRISYYFKSFKFIYFLIQ